MLRQRCKRALGVVDAQWKSAALIRLYHDELIEDHWKFPRNVPKPSSPAFDENDPDVGTGYGPASVKYIMKLQIKVAPNTRKIVDVSHFPVGCQCFTACSSIASVWIKGKEIEEALQFKNSDIANRYESLPCLHTLCVFRGRTAPSWTLISDIALRQAIKNYEMKRGKHPGGSSTSPADQG